MSFFRFVFPFLLLIVGTALLAQGYKHWSTSKQLLDESLTAEGTIVRNAPYMTIKAGKSSALAYFPQVKFLSAEGTTIAFTSKVTSRAEQYQPGDLVRVLYKEDQPDSAVIGSFTALWAIAIIFSASGIVVLLFASWFYRKGIRGWKKEEPVN